MDGIGGIQVDDVIAFHPDARDAVPGGRHDPVVVEADFSRAGFDGIVVIGRFATESEMPFANNARGIAGLLKHGRERGARRINEQSIDAAGDPGACFSKGVFAC